MTSQSNDQPNAPAGLQLSDATNVAGIRRVEEATALPWAEVVAVFEAAGGADADHGALAAAIEAAAARKSTGSGESPRVRVTLTATGLADQDQRDAARSDLKTVLADLG